MGQILHGSATTTAAVRRAIQHSQESLIVLADRYDINPKTVAKWRARETVEDRKTGPSETRSTVLSREEEAIVVAFRRHTTVKRHHYENHDRLRGHLANFIDASVSSYRLTIVEPPDQKNLEAHESYIRRPVNPEGRFSLGPRDRDFLNHKRSVSAAGGAEASARSAICSY